MGNPGGGSGTPEIFLGFFGLLNTRFESFHSILETHLCDLLISGILELYKNEEYFQVLYSQAFENHHKNIKLVFCFLLKAIFIINTAKQHANSVDRSSPSPTHSEQMGPRPRSRKALGNSSNTDPWNLWVLKWSALLDLCPVPPRQAWNWQRRKKYAWNTDTNWNHTNPAPSYMSGNREQVSRLGLDQPMDPELRLAELVFCQPHKPMLEALCDCISIWHTIRNTQTPSFSPSAVVQIKRLQVWQLWNELSQKPEKLN